MTLRRFILLLLLVLLFYLGFYTWNQRTGTLDRVAANTGLEVIGVVLRPMAWIQERLSLHWNTYVALMDAKEDLVAAQEKIHLMTIKLTRCNENAAELKRLRALLTLELPKEWQRIGARVLASRLGPNGILETITIDHGYMTGAGAGTPVVTYDGVVGRVLRAGPFTATVLLAIDPDSRVAVVGQESRTQGVLVGGGAGAPMELLFVPINNALKENELLVTSGLDGVYPKGIPVAHVVQMDTSKLSMFKHITAMPLSNMNALEEVLLLQVPVEQYLPNRYEQAPAADVENASVETVPNTLPLTLPHSVPTTGSSMGSTLGTDTTPSTDTVLNVVPNIAEEGRIPKKANATSKQQKQQQVQ